MWRPEADRTPIGAGRYTLAMPELPEVECVRRTLAAGLVGRRIVAIQLGRHRVVRGDTSPAGLMVGRTIARIDRLGKQLALVAETKAKPDTDARPADPSCVVIHLGMSGQLRLALKHIVENSAAPNHQTLQRSKRYNGSPAPEIAPRPPHCHVVWQLGGGGELRFIDPRRFGGVWTYTTTRQRDAQRWNVLGPDALNLTPAKLHTALSRTHRSIKAALLDQHLVAGLGNIYVDELLFNCRINPLCPADRLSRVQAASLCRRSRSLLTRAIDQGGSTLRDYTDAQGRAGGYQLSHRVYGRAGLTCRRGGCNATLESGVVVGRTTVWCPSCQPVVGA